VIEHLDRPEDALDRAASFVRPGGYVVGTVPALMALWSGIDEHAGHKIRYSRATLRDVLSRAKGASIVEIEPFFRTLVPMMWAQRKLVGRRGTAAEAAQNLAVPAAPVNAALYSLVTLEHAAARALGTLPFPGASLWFALRIIT
jgi:hypothetical protein